MSTQLQQEQLYQDRWSTYGEQSGIKRILEKPRASELKKFSIFKDLEASFLDSISHDLAIVDWEKGAILFEEGSYLDLAFFVIKGGVDIFVDKHQEHRPEPIFNSTFFDASDLRSGLEQERKPISDRSTSQIMMLSSMDLNLAKGQSMFLGEGEVFGEIGTLNGWPQSVTARIAQQTTLLHIRLPALRELRKKSSALKEQLDRIYRERSLRTQLHTTPLFRELPEATIDALAKRVTLISCSPGETLVQQDDPVQALYMVRSGFVRLSQTIEDSDRSVTLTYLSKGMTFGEVELMIDGIEGARHTVSSVGYSELVKIDRADLKELMQKSPAIQNQLWSTAVTQIKETGYTRKIREKAELIEFSLAKGLVQGNSMLVIDLDVCTRCDDCVTGCSNTHGGRPRFVREGDRYENFLITRSCYHCEDPVCLIGCPTGAIRRTNVAEVVAIDDDLCIGCSNCANKCPYDAIVMHDTGEQWSQSAVPSWLRGRERKVASKCDLCYESDSGPACVNSCPHSCAFRIGSLDDFQKLLDVQKAQA